MALVDLINLRKLKHADISKLSEVVQRSKFLTDLRQRNFLRPEGQTLSKFADSGMSATDLKQVIQSGMLTFLLHCEARVASSLGVGFYTIGPCGEELLAAASLHLRPSDASALHYRHVSNSIIRQTLAGRSMDAIALDRARGFVCSTNDPITGGKHCSIGGSKTDFLVTSTLASQAPPAVGRALGIALANRLIPGNSLLPSDAISYMSVGDGSVNNAHYLAALNMAKYASHRKMKCPTVFAISDNGKCISLRGHGYVDEFVRKSGIHHVIADGNDVVDIYTKSKEVIDYSRSLYKPSMILFKNLSRRFGHAATDRQIAYMSTEEISCEANKAPLLFACSLAEEAGILSNTEMAEMFESINDVVEKAFNTAVNEPKITSREALVASNSKPMAPKKSTASVEVPVRYPFAPKSDANSTTTERPEAMRKQMTRVFDEILGSQNDVVYIGEDVEHGGYYLVTEGLAAKYPARVRDFPPDETSIVGAGMGFSQLGLVPIVEIPYSKYLDCAADMFHEAIISNWLSNGSQPNGMVVRLQGFDKGVFGGNFHTHNMLNIPPGLDVVVYSNGSDYVRGMRHAIRQARAGRVVMSVDSTDLLNRRHLYDKDDIFLQSYPAGDAPELGFDDVIVYSRNSAGATKFSEWKSEKRGNIVIVSYGNGLPTSLQAMDMLCNKHGFSADDIIVVDCPYLSSPPQQLKDILSKNASWKVGGVVFADVCKEGPNMPLAGMAINIQNQGLLDLPWRAIGATNTYNPLGRTLTFLNADDIVKSVLQIRKTD